MRQQRHWRLYEELSDEEKKDRDELYEDCCKVRVTKNAEHWIEKFQEALGKQK